MSGTPMHIVREAFAAEQRRRSTDDAQTLSLLPVDDFLSREDRGAALDALERIAVGLEGAVFPAARLSRQEPAAGPGGVVAMSFSDSADASMDDSATSSSSARGVGDDDNDDEDFAKQLTQEGIAGPMLVFWTRSLHEISNTALLRAVGCNDDAGDDAGNDDSTSEVTRHLGLLRRCCSALYFCAVGGTLLPIPPEHVGYIADWQPTATSPQYMKRAADTLAWLLRCFPSAAWRQAELRFDWRPLAQAISICALNEDKRPLSSNGVDFFGADGAAAPPFAQSIRQQFTTRFVQESRRAETLASLMGLAPAVRRYFGPDAARDIVDPLREALRDARNVSSQTHALTMMLALFPHRARDRSGADLDDWVARTMLDLAHLESAHAGGWQTSCVDILARALDPKMRPADATAAQQQAEWKQHLVRPCFSLFLRLLDAATAVQSTGSDKNDLGFLTPGLAFAVTKSLAFVRGRSVAMGHMIASFLMMDAPQESVLSMLQQLTHTIEHHLHPNHTGICADRSARIVEGIVHRLVQDIEAPGELYNRLVKRDAAEQAVGLLTESITRGCYSRSGVVRDSCHRAASAVSVAFPAIMLRHFLRDINVYVLHTTSDEDSVAGDGMVRSHGTEETNKTTAALELVRILMRPLFHYLFSASSTADPEDKAKLSDYLLLLLPTLVQAIDQNDERKTEAALKVVCELTTHSTNLAVVIPDLTEDTWSEFCISFIRVMLSFCESAEARHQWTGADNQAKGKDVSKVAKATRITLRALLASFHGDFETEMLPILEDFLNERILSIAAGDVFSEIISAFCNHTPMNTQTALEKLLPPVLDRVDASSFSEKDTATMLKLASLLVRYGGRTLMGQESRGHTLAARALSTTFRIFDLEQDTLTDSSKRVLRRAADLLCNTLTALTSVYVADYRSGESPLVDQRELVGSLDGEPALFFPDEAGMDAANRACEGALERAGALLSAGSSEGVAEAKRGKFFRASFLLRGCLIGASPLLPAPVLDSRSRPRLPTSGFVKFSRTLPGFRNEVSTLLTSAIQSAREKSDPLGLVSLLKLVQDVLISSDPPDQVLGGSLSSVSRFNSFRSEGEVSVLQRKSYVKPRVKWLVADVVSAVRKRDGYRHCALGANKILFRELLLCGGSVWENVSAWFFHNVHRVLNSCPRSKWVVLDHIMGLTGSLGAQGLSTQDSDASAEFRASVRSLLQLVQVRQISRALTRSLAVGSPIQNLLTFVAGVFANDALSSDEATRPLLPKAIFSLLVELRPSDSPSNGLVDLLLLGTALQSSAVSTNWQWLLFQLVAMCLLVDPKADVDCQGGTLQRMILSATDLTCSTNASIRVFAFKTLFFLTSTIYDVAQRVEDGSAGSQYLNQLTATFCAHLDAKFDTMVDWIVSDHRAADVQHENSSMASRFGRNFFGGGDPGIMQFAGIDAFQNLIGVTRESERLTVNLYPLSNFSLATAHAWSSVCKLILWANKPVKLNGAPLLGRMFEKAASLSTAMPASSDADHPLDRACTAAELVAGLMQGSLSCETSLQGEIAKRAVELALTCSTLDSITDWSISLQFGVAGSCNADVFKNLLDALCSAVMSVAGISSPQLAQRLLMERVVLAECADTLAQDALGSTVVMLRGEIAGGTPGKLLANEFKNGRTAFAELFSTVLSSTSWHSELSGVSVDVLKFASEFCSSHVTENTISLAGEHVADVLLHCLVTLLERSDSASALVVSDEVQKVIIGQVLPLAFRLCAISYVRNAQGEIQPSDIGQLALSLVSSIAFLDFLPMRTGAADDVGGYSTVAVFLRECTRAEELRFPWKVTQALLACVQVSMFSAQFELSAEQRDTAVNVIRTFLVSQGTSNGSESNVRTAEVRDSAQAAVAVLVRGGVIHSEHLQNDWLRPWLEAVDKAVKKSLRRRRSRKSGTARKKVSSALEGAVAGLCALLTAHPYRISGWIPELVETLTGVIRAFEESEFVSRLVSSSFSEWWRSQREFWPQNAHLFTPSQRELVAEFVVVSQKASYIS